MLRIKLMASNQQHFMTSRCNSGLELTTWFDQIHQWSTNEVKCHLKYIYQWGIMKKCHLV